MAYVPLVQAWEASRQERTPLPARQRVASIEFGDGAAKRPPSFLDWLLDRDDDQVEQGTELDEDEREAGA